MFEEAATASKATVYEMENTSYLVHTILSFLLRQGFTNSIEPRPYLGTHIFLPIIVFDGTMFLWRGRDTQLEETDHVVYLFDHRSPNYFGRRIINVVSKVYVAKLLDGLESDLSRLVHAFHERRDELDKQVRLIIQAV